MCKACNIFLFESSHWIGIVYCCYFWVVIFSLVLCEMTACCVFIDVCRSDANVVLDCVCTYSFYVHALFFTHFLCPIFSFFFKPKSLSSLFFELTRVEGIMICELSFSFFVFSVVRHVITSCYVLLYVYNSNYIYLVCKTCWWSYLECW